MANRFSDRVMNGAGRMTRARAGKDAKVFFYVSVHEKSTETTSLSDGTIMEEGYSR